MNTLFDAGPPDLLGIVDRYRHLLAVVVAVVREDGHLIDGNAGLLRLLQARTDAQSVQVEAFFIQPRFHTLAATPGAGRLPVYEGMLTVGDNQVSCHSLLGSVRRAGSNLIVIAEFDVVEMENLNAQVLQFNEQLIDMQRQLARSERHLRASEAQHLQLSLTDPLTGLGNRRQLERIMLAAVQREERHGELFSLIMLDIDHFKRINDVYGHDTGDAVLCHTATLLRGALREPDLVARIGGEEFILVLPRADLRMAFDCAERLRLQIMATRPPGLDDDMSASFGVTQYEPGASLANVMKQVDQALYMAKTSGRNRVEAWHAGGLTTALPPA